MAQFYKQPLKAKFSDLYYKNLYINYYQFYQKCKEYFDITKTINLNIISFAILFSNKIMII